MADGSIVIETEIDNKQAQKELEKLTKQIHNLESQLSTKQGEKNAIADQMRAANAAVESTRQEIAELEAQLAEVNAIISPANTASIGDPAEVMGAMTAQVEIEGELARQKTLLESQTKEAEKLNGKYQKINENVSRISGELDEAKTQAGALARQVEQGNSTSARMAEAAENAQQQMGKLVNRVKGLAKRVFVFSVITMALRQLREWLMNIIKANDEATAAIAQLKGSLATLAQPILSVVIPAFISFVNILTKVVNAIAFIVSSLFGTTVKASAAAAESLYEQQKALEGVGGAAAEAEGQLASFDEINQLTTESSGGGGGGGMSTDIPFDFSAAQEDALTLDTVKDAVLGLAAAMGILGLAFGPVGAGIAGIVGGGALLVTAFKDMFENGMTLENTLMAIAGLLGGGLGISLLTKSWIPLFIAAIAGLILAMVNYAGKGEELIAGIKELLSGFLDFFKGVFTGDIDLAVQGIGKIFDGLGKIVGAIIDSIRIVLDRFLQWFEQTTGIKLTAVRELFSTVFNRIKVTVQDVLNGVKTILSGLVEFIMGAFTGDWDRAWDGVANVFKGIWNTIIGLLDGAMNLIIDGINWILQQINKISFTAPDWVPGIGGATIGINIPLLPSTALPRLAQGAVIPPNQEFLAVLGDQKSGTNIEAPLETIKQALVEAMQEGGMGGTITVVVNLDGKEVARNQVRHINNMTRAAGKPVLLT